MNSDQKHVRVEAHCGCGHQVELWVPPTVRCPACGAIYVWTHQVQCIHAPRGAEYFLAVMDVAMVDRKKKGTVPA